MKQRSLLRALACYYPKSIREEFDFGGLMAGRIPDNIQKVLICLDFDDEVLPLAIKTHPDIIITHHPFFFGTPVHVMKEDPIKKKLYENVLKNSLCVYSLHTNFDAGHPGMNDALAEALELTDVVEVKESPMMRGGRLKEPMEVHEFAKYAKEKLNVDYGLLIACGKQTIETVALIGGGGWHDNKLAQEKGFDIYISGDIPHHGRRDVVLRHYNYLDLPHEIENIFVDRMKRTLLEIDPSLEIVECVHEKLPEVI
ncbi:MAG: Nif3-like dinuclear metal center hexameric protein [Bacilli bacterium]|nr:Nif3-like dinuclear metal center hexameric protein [Bacilli bacterium]